MSRPTRPTDADAFGDLPSPDEYAATGHRLKPLSRYDRELAAWRNREQAVARSAIAVTATSEGFADRLLVGGIWLDGPFRPVFGGESLWGWLSTLGVYVEDTAVQARDVGGAQRTAWLTFLEHEPAEDCDGSGTEATEEDWEAPRDDRGDRPWIPVPAGTPVPCFECEHSVEAVTGETGTVVVPVHDRRGRLIVDGRTVHA